MTQRRHEAAQLRIPPQPFGISAAEASVWEMDGPDGADRPWRSPLLRRLPDELAGPIAKRYRRTWEQIGRAAANTELRESTEGVTRSSVRLSASDQEIRDKAAACASACVRLGTHCRDKQARYTALAEYADAHGLTSAPVERYGLKGAVARMCDPRWWRRALRREQGQRIEALSIRLGFVQRRASIYVSASTLQRVRQQQRLNQQALENTYLQNDEDPRLWRLDELVALSNADPRIRRNEMMVRIAGMEKFADSLGHVGVFLTITCPSRFHARLSASGQENPTFDGSTPRQGQAYLQKLWSQIRAELKRQDLAPYGIRVAEPHHDGTPHWHLLVFLPQEQKGHFVNVCRRYALKDSPDEPGAQEQRFKSVDIDRDKGTAAGYVAKYVSKNIDGHGIDADDYGHEAASSAERVRAWASTWRIRQFQFFGGPPVTVWRELRRLPDAIYVSETVEAARQAADAGDWYTYMAIMGGDGCEQSARPIRLAKQWSDKQGAYGEPLGEIVFGVRCGDVEVQTRFHVWTVVEAPKQPDGQPVDVYGIPARIRIGETVTDQSVTVTDTVTVTEPYTEEVAEVERWAVLG